VTRPGRGAQAVFIVNINSETLKLYAHQAAAVDWLTERPHAMLLDDPGLGKTAVAICAALRVSAARVLVIVPSVVAWNWEYEWGLWAPGCPVHVVTAGRETFAERGVIVVTHGLLLAPWIRAQITRETWDVCVLDEAHCFRTPEAKRTRAFYGSAQSPGIVSQCSRVWLLTGTPMPNNAAELWTHLHGLFPSRILNEVGEPYKYTGFINRYCVARRTIYGRKIVGNKRASELRARLRGLALRRLKRDVLPDLPAIRYEIVALGGGATPPELAAPEKIRQALLDEDFAALRGMTEYAAFRRLCGLVKIQPCVDLLADEIGMTPGHKVVVFAHHVDVIAGISEGLIDHGFDGVTITGAQNARERRAAVMRFQKAPTVRFAVCNIVAGGVGVTLTAASEVFFAEVSFVPGQNAQAADRCHRIGQARGVRVRFAALAHTIDVDIMEILRQKTRMIREVLAESVTPVPRSWKEKTDD
jgi:SWI/SNF-related matrix-associated actin-dependent regulator 1 of chromatin subfamily A